MGGLLVLLGAGRSILIVAAGVPFLAALDGFILIGGPGLGLLFGRYWLARGDIRPDAYSRVAAWCLGGAGVMIVVIGLIELNPAGGIDRPFFTPFIAIALGTVGGFVIGVHEARAVSRTHEAEEHRDQFRAERDLRERIVDTSPIGIAVVNADRSIRIVNERAAKITGLPRDELLEQECDESMLEATDAEGNPLEDGVFKQVLTTGDAVYDVERNITRPGGQRIWLSVNGAPLRDPSGEITAVVFAFENITERKQLEQNLKETVERLEQSNDRLRQFAYAASHDLQEPLRMVSSYLQLLENRYKDDLDTDARDFIEFAVNGADRMREMVDDLLAYSQVEQSDGEFKPVDCDTIVEEVLADLHVQIEETDAEIVSEPLPTVEANANHLEKLFQNLISNALKYNNSDPPEVEIAAEQRKDTWEFSVSDNGVGIDPEKTDRIFEVFKRLHHDDEYPGTGIGLSLCQEIAENHGGEIWVESDPGEGSTFCFTLPQRTTARRQEGSL
jgi:PAS domain S-box-containing protein